MEQQQQQQPADKLSRLLSFSGFETMLPVSDYDLPFIIRGLLGIISFQLLVILYITSSFNHEEDNEIESVCK